jgi:geranylgeranyl diphosphate synthase type I/geranylgeranyl diphosphate synthase type II
MYKPMRQYLKVKGKLFRPLLTCMCIEGYGQNPDLFKPIIAISEIIHSSSLILDDIADASLLRRGKLCSHHIYGIHRAANASSAMTFYAFKLLQSNKVSLDVPTKIKLYEVLLWEHYITNIGSALDLGWAWEKRNNIPEKEFIQHVFFRSCSYTYRHAARLGASVVGAASGDLDKIFKYSSFLGIAFQMVDDILNLKPQLKSWGKTIAEDITEGKRSLLVLYCLNKASLKDSNRLKEILDGNHSDRIILEEGIHILQKYGAFEYVFGKAEEYIEKACSVLKDTEMTNIYKSLFEDFAYYVIERKI